MKSIPIGKATASLAEYARRPGREALVVTIAGRPRLAVVPLRDADMESIRLSTHPEFMALIEQSRRRLDREGGLCLAQVRRRYGLKPRRRMPA